MADAERNLLIEIDFDIENDPLFEANEATDELVDRMDDLDAQVMDVGENGAAAFEDMGGAADNTSGSVRGLGDESLRSGDEARQSFDAAGGALERMGELGSQAMSAISAGMAAIASFEFTRVFYDAASALETAQFRAKWFADEAEGGFEGLNDVVQRTKELSHGLHAEGELYAAANQAFVVGAGVKFITDNMEAAAVVSAKTGYSIGQVMRELGRAMEYGAIRQLMDMDVITEETFNKLGFEMTRSIMDWDRYDKELLIATGLQDFMNKSVENYGDYLETSGAQMGIFRSELGNIEEVMGGPLLEPANAMLGLFSDLFKEMQKDPLGQRVLEFLGWAVAIGSVVTGGLGLVKVLGLLKPLFLPVLKFAAIGAAAVLIIDDLIVAFGGLGDSITESLFDATMDFLGFDYSFQEFREDIISGLQLIGDFFVGIWNWIKGAWGEGEGWLANLVNGMGIMFGGWLSYLANLFKAGFGLIWGIFTGDWTMLEEGFQGLVDSTGQIWDGIKLMISQPLDWAIGKFEEWKEWGLQKIDDLVEGFFALPDRIMEGIGDIGDRLKTIFAEGLQSVRDMLPFSPPKMGPLTDIMEAGGNIVNTIQDGIDQAGGLSLGRKLKQMMPEVDVSPGNGRSAITTTATGGAESITIINEIHLGHSAVSTSEGRELAVMFKKMLQIYGPEWIDDFFRQKGKARPALVER